jgi:phosphoribosylamine---glycine ligase
MKILVIGGGGREHAIVWSMRRTMPDQLDIYCAPGNAGIAQLATILPISVSQIADLAAFAEAEKVDLTFVGPEAPLADGIVDFFESKGLPIVGPVSVAARLEGSKIFAKDFMSRYRIPTAAYRMAESFDQAKEYLRSGEFGDTNSSVVIKADGLAAGKGVVVANSIAEGEKAVEDLMINHLAGVDAARRVVIEETLIGREASLLVFCDGRNYALMPAARDHKRIGDNDTGPNTGGMGAVTDPSILSSSVLQQVVTRIVEPTLEGARREGFSFKGILFLGLMLTAEGPKLLEYNVRFGDPETQAILMRLETNLVSIFDSIRTGTLDKLQVQWTDGASACVVVANQGYPGKYETGAIIEGLSDISDSSVQVFHAGTATNSDGRFIATGGRVLGVTAIGDDLPGALQKCYQSLEKIQWPGMQYRRDIGR